MFAKANEDFNLLMKELPDHKTSREARQLCEARNTMNAVATRHVHNSQPKKKANTQNSGR